MPQIITSKNLEFNRRHFSSQCCNVWKYIFVPILLLLAAWGIVSCGDSTVISGPDTTVQTPTSRSFLLATTWSGPGTGPWEAGSRTWRWQTTEIDSTGLASLCIDFDTNSNACFYWTMSPPPPDGVPIELIPDDSWYWHTQTIADSCAVDSVAIPLPRQPADSTHYHDVLDLLQTLTTNRFNQIVTHWPELPIPVRIGSAVSGDVDLSDCLSIAVDIWNSEEERPYFYLCDTADWGVRLIHYPTVHLRPPLYARITRLDGYGRPIRVNVTCGDNYDDLIDVKYAIRGMVHELTHCLFLWGHSSDRIHSVWGAAPPQIREPSEDERKAARLWHGLPDGLDLSNYGRVIEP